MRKYGSLNMAALSIVLSGGRADLAGMPLGIVVYGFVGWKSALRAMLVPAADMTIVVVT